MGNKNTPRDRGCFLGLGKQWQRRDKSRLYNRVLIYSDAGTGFLTRFLCFEHAIILYCLENIGNWLQTSSRRGSDKRSGAEFVMEVRLVVFS